MSGVEFEKDRRLHGDERHRPFHQWRYDFFGLFTEPPISSQACLDMVTKPWPLHLEWPLQALLAVLQSLWPLHLFTPKQCTLVSLPACTAVMGAAENRAAAAEAIAMVANLRLVVIYPPGSIGLLVRCAVRLGHASSTPG